MWIRLKLPSNKLSNITQLTQPEAGVKPRTQWLATQCTITKLTAPKYWCMLYVKLWTGLLEGQCFLLLYCFVHSHCLLPSTGQCPDKSPRNARATQVHPLLCSNPLLHSAPGSSVQTTLAQTSIQTAWSGWGCTVTFLLLIVAVMSLIWSLICITISCICFRLTGRTC